MTRRYLVLSLVAFAGYSLVAPTMKVAMRTVPSTTAVFLSNLVMLVLVSGLLAYRGHSPMPYLRHPKAPYIVLTGLVLSVGLLTYYRAIDLGPVSVVVPIYGLFIVLSSIIGITLLDESLTARKAAGIALAMLAIVLMSV